jgi:flavocytochrome c
VKRSHAVEGSTGAGLVNPMLAKARAAGVKLETRAKLVRLIADKSGQVVGAELRRGYRFPDDKSGTPAFVRTRRGVVLASGGFSNDVTLRQLHDPRLTDRFDSTNQPGATGEAITAASLVGAAQVQMDWIQLGPWTSPDEKGFGHVPLFCEPMVGYGPMVNPKTGKRFFKETGNRKERADAIVLIGAPVVILGDAEMVKQQVQPHILQKGLESGAIRKFDTLEALAQHYAMPVPAFLEEVKRWNGFVEARKDADFDCMIFKDTKPTATAPFYAVRLWPRVHHTMGGLAVDANAQVLGFDLKPVRGLYAAGEATGGVHGAVRLGSVAMADCVVFGRIAGRSVAQAGAAAA